MSGDLDAAVAQQVATVATTRPAQAAAIRTAADVVPKLMRELGLLEFLGPVLVDDKPRLLLRFRTAAGAPLDIGPSVVLKVYPDQPRGEGPLMALWHDRGLPVPRLRFGERSGCSWLALEELALSPVQPATPEEALALTREVAAFGRPMHEPAPELAPVLRPLPAVMLPRWDAAVAALASAGLEVPPSWRSRAEAAYRCAHPAPLHGDIGPPNLGRDVRGHLVLYDASALTGPLAFDAARWAARLADGTLGPEPLFAAWGSAENGLASADGELLAAECVLEAGSRVIVAARKRVGDATLVTRGIAELVGTAEGLFGSA